MIIKTVKTVSIEARGTINPRLKSWVAEKNPGRKLF